MTDSDIVTRLRQRWLAHQDKDVRFVVVHAGEWMRCTDLTREAADEIERLRQERDEARREACHAEVDGYDSAENIAKERGWDCFPEPTP